MIRLLVAAILACVMFANAEEVIDRVVAVVDDEIILESEVLQYMQYTMGTEANLDSLSQEQLTQLSSQVLDDLIAQKLLLTRARADSITVTQKEVDRELDGRIKNLMDQVGGQDKLESYYGMPLSKIKRQFRPLVEETLLIERMRHQHMANVKVSRSEVVEFWNAIKDSVPPLRDAIRLAHILLQELHCRWERTRRSPHSR